jgi:hypothetical protein
MSSDEEDRSPARALDEADQSADMESRLDQLDDHITDARKKADDGRPLGDPADADDPLDDVAGGGTDNTEEVDDPAGPIIGPE